MDDLHLHASLHSNRQAVRELVSGRSWTYGEFDHWVAVCVARLAALGLSQGDRVACLSLNRAEQIALHLACARLGLIYVPLNWRLSDGELQQIIADCEPSLFVSDNPARLGEYRWRHIDDFDPERMQLLPLWHSVSDPDLPSLMLYTSGTTGVPKGVMLSERNLAETAINFSILGEVDSNSHFLCESPMFHIIGMVTSIRPALLEGARISISDGFDADRTMAWLSDAALGLTHYFCVPQMAQALRKSRNYNPRALQHMKALFTGGAPHAAAHIEAWLDDGVPVADGYGMSEAGTVFGMPVDPELIRRKVGCVGLPTPRVQARIVDSDGKPVPDGEPGELQLRGQNVCVGYWRRSEEFARANTEDGWFHTGDILTRDADGYYRVSDRKKDMYISGGENVYPAEVEAALAHFPGLDEFAVVGVPDERWGEVGCLFYVAPQADIQCEDVEAFLTGKLARYKIPRRLVALEALPRTGVGKIKKHALRDHFDRAEDGGTKG